MTKSLKQNKKTEPIKKTTKERVCQKCLAHYTGTHECFGLMKELVKFNKKKAKVCPSCDYEEFGTPCPRCGRGHKRIWPPEDLVKLAQREIREWTRFLKEAQKK